jgi:hypothetical protein
VTKILHDPAVIGVRDFYEIERDEKDGAKKRVVAEEVQQKRVFPPIVDEEIYKKAQ